ncbi:LysR family transcriptional regulator [Nocardioides ginsengisoli]
MMSDVRIRDLEWLVALADHQHVTDTAAILGITQPTLSRALARVEDELGVRLFERVPDGLVTSPHGAFVVETARDLVGRYRQLTTELEARLDPDRGIVRLAFLDSMATSLVPRILRGFHQEAPGVRVELSQEPAHAMRRDLAAGAVDLAITSVRPDGDYGWLILQRERLVVIVPPTHRLRTRKRIELRELAGEELVTTPVGFGYRTLVDGLLTDAGVSLAVSFESADLATIEGLVAAGLGIAVVPEAFVGISGTVGLALSGSNARRSVGLTWRTDRALEPAAARFRDYVAGQAPYSTGLEA